MGTAAVDAAMLATVCDGDQGETQATEQETGKKKLKWWQSYADFPTWRLKFQFTACKLKYMSLGGIKLVVLSGRFIYSTIRGQVLSMRSKWRQSLKVDVVQAKETGVKEGRTPNFVVTASQY